MQCHSKHIQKLNFKSTFEDCSLIGFNDKVSWYLAEYLAEQISQKIHNNWIITEEG